MIINEVVYLIGSFAHHIHSNYVERFNWKTGSPSEKLPGMPIKVDRMAGCAVRENKIMTFGGCTGSIGAIICSLDLDNMKWTAGMHCSLWNFTTLYVPEWDKILLFSGGKN